MAAKPGTPSPSTITAALNQLNHFASSGNTRSVQSIIESFAAATAPGSTTGNFGSTFVLMLQALDPAAYEQGANDPALIANQKLYNDTARGLTHVMRVMGNSPDTWQELKTALTNAGYSYPGPATAPAAPAAPTLTAAQQRMRDGLNELNHHGQSTNLLDYGTYMTSPERRDSLNDFVLGINARVNTDRVPWSTVLSDFRTFSSGMQFLDGLNPDNVSGIYNQVNKDLAFNRGVIDAASYATVIYGNYIQPQLHPHYENQKSSDLINDVVNGVMNQFNALPKETRDLIVGVIGDVRSHVTKYMNDLKAFQDRAEQSTTTTYDGLAKLIKFIQTGNVADLAAAPSSVGVASADVSPEVIAAVNTSSQPDLDAILAAYGGIDSAGISGPSDPTKVSPSVGGTAPERDGPLPPSM